MNAMHKQRPAILLIEDDDFMSSLLTFMLERQSMQVVHVADGPAALAQIEGPNSVDAVLLDLMLPQVSGMEVLAQLKAHPVWADTPVVVLSALDSGAQIAQALRAGAADYLTKPFNPEELLARLTRLLPSHAAATSADRP